MNKKTVEEILLDKEKEITAWQNIACYLLDCHAATASHEALLKTSSVSFKKRMVEICESGALMVETGCFTKSNVNVGRNLEGVVKRCENSVSDLKNALSKK